MVEERLSRRAFLGASAATLAGLGLAGCGADEAAPARDDLTILSAAISRERAAAADLATLAGALDGEAAAAVQRAAAHDRAHAARLVRVLRERGGSPPRTAHPAAAAPEGSDPLALPRLVKERAFAAYLDDLAELRSPELRRLVASIAAVEAEHAAALRELAGGDPLAGAFVMGAAR